MMYAVDSNGERVYPSKGLIALCPSCNKKVLSKCGQINIWHWSHESLSDCDDWYETETIWHRDWKLLFPENCREITIGRHRADIFFNNRVIELQHSTISVEDIKERESFYSYMVWIIDLQEYENIELRPSKYDYYCTFRWKHPRKSYWYITKPLFLDLGDKVLFVKKIHHSIPCGGWGYLMPKNKFIEVISQ